LNRITYLKRKSAASNGQATPAAGRPSSPATSSSGHGSSEGEEVKVVDATAELPLTRTALHEKSDDYECNRDSGIGRYSSVYGQTPNYDENNDDDNPDDVVDGQLEHKTGLSGTSKKPSSSPAEVSPTSKTNGKLPLAKRLSNAQSSLLSSIEEEGKDLEASKQPVADVEMISLGKETKESFSTVIADATAATAADDDDENTVSTIVPGGTLSTADELVFTSLPEVSSSDDSRAYGRTDSNNDAVDSGVPTSEEVSAEDPEPALAWDNLDLFAAASSLIAGFGSSLKLRTMSATCEASPEASRNSDVMYAETGNKIPPKTASVVPLTSISIPTSIRGEQEPSRSIATQALTVAKPDAQRSVSTITLTPGKPDPPKSVLSSTSAPGKQFSPLSVVTTFSMPGKADLPRSASNTTSTFERQDLLTLSATASTSGKPDLSRSVPTTAPVLGKQRSVSIIPSTADKPDSPRSVKTAISTSGKKTRPRSRSTTPSTNGKPDPPRLVLTTATASTPGRVEPPRRRVINAEFLTATRDTPRPKKPPMFIRRMKNVNVVEGQTARFEVRIDGNPAASMSWHKNGVELAVDGCKYSVEGIAEDGRWSLLIFGCTEDDMAEYGCTGVNDLGRITSSAQLFVERAETGKH